VIRLRTCGVRCSTQASILSVRFTGMRSTTAGKAPSRPPAGSDAPPRVVSAAGCLAIAALPRSFLSLLPMKGEPPRRCRTKLGELVTRPLPEVETNRPQSTTAGVTNELGHRRMAAKKYRGRVHSIDLIAIFIDDDHLRSRLSNTLREPSCGPVEPSAESIRIVGDPRLTFDLAI
jgi:hypothetical protein